MFLKVLPRLLVIIFIFSLFGCAQVSQESSKEIILSLEDFKEQYQELTRGQKQLLELDPDNLELRIRLAEFYYDFKDYSQAKDILESVDSQEAKIVLAKSLVKAKDYDYAIEIFEQSKVIIKDNEYLYLYGQVLEEKNLFPKALKVYEEVGGSFKGKAQKRIKAIKIRVEGNIPEEVKAVSREAEDFLKSVEDDAAIYLLVDEDIEIKPDNTSVSTVHIIKKVLQERGKRIAEVEMGYDSTYERMELEYARTITKEGKVIYAGGESIRDVSRYLNFPLYSNSRAFIISMPSVEVGSFIEYKVKIYSSKLINQDDFNFVYRLREGYPVFKSKFDLTIPNNRDINFKFLNKEHAKGINLEPKLIKKDNKKVYSWEFDEIESIIPEYSMPSGSYINPAILISSFSSWDEVYNWWKSLYKDKLKLNKEVKDFVDELVKDATTDYEKAKILSEFVAKNIRYVAIEYGDSGHEPHYATEVFMNKYGDCKDQAILLVAMLRYIGLKGYPVLIPTRSAYSMHEDFPSAIFNHAICAVEIDEELIFTDSTAETTAFGYVPLGDQGRLTLVFTNDKWRIAKIKDIEDNGLVYDMDIVIDQDESAAITRQVSTKGFYSSSYRWYLKHTHPAIIKEEIQQKMMKISSFSKLIDYQISDVDNFDTVPSLIYRFETEEFLNPARDLRIVPVLDQVSLDHGLISKDQRDYPIDFEAMHSITANIKITLPDNLEVKYLPRSIAVDNFWFTLKVLYQENPNGVNFNQTFKVKKRFVEKGDYEEFKGYLKEALYLLREEIILEKK
ncbi:MAG: DUF3857 domain-containing protein [Candidatus Omnitrophica bacterium]|nr:DUF3857 domain-containing protein [Candidatus Omnitrophota bacterium]